MSEQHFPVDCNWRFERLDNGDGVRIYARCGGRIVAGLDAGYCGRELAIAVIYVLPSWRKTEVAALLREQFSIWLDTAAG